MASTDPDRRRFVIATIVTLLALPALWWVNQDDSSGAPNVASVGVDIGSAEQTGDDAPAADTPLGVDEPVFLDGPSSGQGGTPEIAVPAPPLRPPITGSATYSSVIISTGKCFAKDVTTGATITVVNLDNNRSTTCVVTLAPPSQRESLVMHTQAFVKLADLTDAPIPVEIRR